MIDRPFRGIFDRDHAKVGVSGFDFLENLLEAAHRQRPHRMTEVGQHRALAKGTFRPQKCHP